MPDPQDQPEHGSNAIPESAKPPEPPAVPEPAQPAETPPPAKKAPAKAAKKAAAKKAPAKKGAKKSPAKKAPAKKAPAAAQVPQPGDTNGSHQLAAGAREAAAQAKSAVDAADSPVAPPPTAGRSRTAVLAAATLGLLALLLIRQLRRRSAR